MIIDPPPPPPVLYKLFSKILDTLVFKGLKASIKTLKTFHRPFHSILIKNSKLIINKKFLGRSSYFLVLNVMYTRMASLPLPKHYSCRHLQ